MEEEAAPPPAHIVIIPSPGMGHMIPLVEFAKLLVGRFGFAVSLLIPTTTRPTPAQISLLNSLPPSISHTFLDPAQLPAGAAPEVTIHLTHHHSVSSVREALAGLARRARPVALVTDLFGTDYYEVAREFGIPPYMYFTTTAMCLLFALNLPRLDETVSCEYSDMPDPLVLPGCVPLHGRDFVDPCMDRRDESYRLLLYHVKRYVLAEGIFVNTFLELEPGAIRALQTEDPSWPPVYPVGPIIKSGLGGDQTEGGGSECLEWLDQQPTGSVLFVSFGSGGTLSTRQLNELAIGLEKSGQRFLWVVRSPNDHSSSATFFTTRSQDDPFGFLPDGYLDRIKDRGLLVPSWAPQVKVLGHGSTGGFLTHCGWNSILESITNGVPLIAWPLYAEQRMNAVMLNQGIKIALRPKCNESGLYEADEITRVVKELMEGEEGKETRRRMKELSNLAKKAISEDGASSKLLAQVAHQWSHSKDV